MRYLGPIISILICVSCLSPEQRVINQAGTNGGELQKVLDHFKNDSIKEKYEAAKFLIRNIGGHFAYDTSRFHEYKLFLDTANYLHGTYRGNNIDSVLISEWKKHKARHRRGKDRNQVFYDYKFLTADFLIKDIDLAYSAWKENPYGSKVTFNEFKEYILPYRVTTGKSLESWRSYFYEREKDHFSKYYPDSLISACDKLLSHYKYFKHNYNSVQEISLLRYHDFEQLKRGSCQDRCWYNMMLFRSLGVACATDFVPHWGNRNRNHSWNVIIQHGASYAFEPFWDEERWKYKILYNNRSWDRKWGKFRLPKVYRYTYSDHIIGPLQDKRVRKNNIPHLFRNRKLLDVSTEYFNTTNVNIKLFDTLPDATFYCYLCVWGNRRWHPVQYGKIINNKASFIDMGRDIVYLPCICKDGKLLPASNPFLLDEYGCVKELTASIHKRSIVVSKVLPQEPQLGDGIRLLKGSRFEIANDSSFNKRTIIYNIPDTMLYENNFIHLKRSAYGRYVRLLFSCSNKEIGLSNLEFYKKDSEGKLIRLEGSIIKSNNIHDG
ncbi:hypothetical protein K4L44_06850 [Halosquirtibacter laminarini]|uniref:Uncharacterized protein n=1 Tax=Halosquirtibacter laminarini TaxID=3374600 RepID=A0AC61NPK7_9BACT|nr:hypothetical protein K4L44_06850 [Prolixibacteraceae bacterium]